MWKTRNKRKKNKKNKMAEFEKIKKKVKLAIAIRTFIITVEEHMALLLRKSKAFLPSAGGVIFTSNRNVVTETGSEMIIPF